MGKLNDFVLWSHNMAINVRRAVQESQLARTYINRFCHYVYIFYKLVINVREVNQECKLQIVEGCHGMPPQEQTV